MPRLITISLHLPIVAKRLVHSQLWHELLVISAQRRYHHVQHINRIPSIELYQTVSAQIAHPFKTLLRAAHKQERVPLQLSFFERHCVKSVKSIETIKLQGFGIQHLSSRLVSDAQQCRLDRTQPRVVQTTVPTLT